MIVTARQFCVFVLFIALINIVGHVIYSLYEMTDEITTVRHSRIYKYGKPVVVNIPQNWKDLYDLIICNATDTRDVSAVYLKNEANAYVYPNISDFRFQYYFSSDVENSRGRPCPYLAPDLGPVADDKAIRSLFGIEDMYMRIQPGGIHIPIECLALQQVAIVVPVHETRRSALSAVTIRRFIGSFLYYIHPFLMKQQLEYQVFVILKLNTTTPYKRGELFNIGFKEAQNYRPGGWDCIIFHDPHLVPLDTRNLYRCGRRPRKLIADFQKPYRFGGAVALRPKHFVKANGFSNYIWSNDGDYIDMYKRLIAANFTVDGNIVPIGNYSYFELLRQENYEPEKSQTNPPYYLKDGLSTVSYNIKNTMKLKQFYTLIEVEAETSIEIISTSDIAN